MAPFKSGATIHFETDGSTPTDLSPVFSIPFSLPLGNQTVKAFALKAGFIDGFVTTAIYTVQDVVEPVTFSPVTSDIFDDEPITLSTITSGATIHFTTDGSEPTESSPEFMNPFLLSAGVKTVRAFGVKTNFIDSIKTQKVYTVTAAFDPLTISNRVFWVDANDVSSVTTVGSDVSGWSDQGGNGNNLEQTSATQRPIYNTAVTPHFIVFDGANDRMLQLNPSALSQPNTFFLVARAVTNADNSRFSSTPIFGASFFGERTSVWVARAIYRFVGVDEGFDPELSRRVNVGDYRSMPESVRALLLETYRDQILRFQEMTGRDLSHWLTRP